MITRTELESLIDSELDGISFEYNDDMLSLVSIKDKQYVLTNPSIISATDKEIIIDDRTKQIIIRL